MERDVAWWSQVLAWLEAGFATGPTQRMALRSTGLKLVRCPDSPGPGVTTLCTFEHSARTWPAADDPDLHVGYELVSALSGDADQVTLLRRAVEVLAAVSRPPQPGNVLMDLCTGLDGLHVDLRHGILVAPWAWDGLEPLHAPPRRVEAVCVVPASTAEVELLKTEGWDALAERWERDLTPLVDPGRRSAVG